MTNEEKLQYAFNLGALSVPYHMDIDDVWLNWLFDNEVEMIDMA